MGLADKANKEQGKLEKQTSAGIELIRDANRLNKYELELLLKVLETSKFTITGREVESIYNMIVKLQNQYDLSSKFE